MMVVAVVVKCCLDIARLKDGVFLTACDSGAGVSRLLVAVACGSDLSCESKRLHCPVHDGVRARASEWGRGKVGGASFAAEDGDSGSLRPASRLCPTARVRALPFGAPLREHSWLGPWQLDEAARLRDATSCGCCRAGQWWLARRTSFR